MTFLKSFLGKDDGAVTVDWVVLTAIVLGLSLGAFAAIGGSTGQLAADLAATIENQEVDITID